MSYYNKHDLYFTVGTAHTLQGDYNLKGAEILKNCLDLVDLNNQEVKMEGMKLNKGYALNNTAMSKFWEFVTLASVQDENT